MLTFIWLLITTSIGYVIEAKLIFPEPATWVGAAWGFGIGLVLRLIAAGASGGGLGDIFDAGSSFGDGGSCGGDGCGGD